MGRRSGLVLSVGILNLLAAVALYFGNGYAVGLAWLGAFDLYVALEKGDVIDHAKLAAYDPTLAQHYALGHRLIDAPTSAAYEVITVCVVMLALEGIALCTAAVLARRSRPTQL